MHSLFNVRNEVHFSDFIYLKWTYLLKNSENAPVKTSKSFLHLIFTAPRSFIGDIICLSLIFRS